MYCYIATYLKIMLLDTYMHASKYMLILKVKLIHVLRLPYSYASRALMITVTIYDAVI